MHETLSVISGLVFVAGYVPYILSIVRGTTKPSMFSWIIWAILDLMLSYGQYAKGELAFQAIGAGCGSWIVFFLSLRKGKKEWGWVEIACTVCGLVGVVLWKTLDNPTWGVGMAAFGVLVGAIPTFRHAWKEPEAEDHLTWMIWTISCVIQLLALRTWTVDSATQPLAFTAIEIVMMYLLFVRPRRPTTDASPP